MEKVQKKRLCLYVIQLLQNLIALKQANMKRIKNLKGLFRGLTLLCVGTRDRLQIGDAFTQFCANVRRILRLCHDRFFICLF